MLARVLITVKHYTGITPPCTKITSNDTKDLHIISFHANMAQVFSKMIKELSDYKRITFVVDEEFHTDFKVATIKRGTSMSKVCRDILCNWLGVKNTYDNPSDQNELVDHTENL